MARLHPAARETLALLAVAVFGWLDYVTGPDLGFSLFYLVPIVATASWTGRPAAVRIAGAATMAWFLAEITTRPEIPLAISAWNGLTRAVLYQAIGVLVANQRRDHDRLGALNRRLEELLANETALARTDALTGLPNGRAFREMLEHERARSLREGTSIALAYVDLDRFKAVNDRYGHAGGDDLLRLVGRTLAAAVRTGDVAARVGGDEFVLLLPNIRQEAAEAVSRRVLERLREATGDFAREVGFGASIGLAWFPGALHDADEMLRRADAAVYEAKEGGRGRVVSVRAGAA